MFTVRADGIYQHQGILFIGDSGVGKTSIVSSLSTSLPAPGIIGGQLDGVCNRAIEWGLMHIGDHARLYPTTFRETLPDGIDETGKISYRDGFPISLIIITLPAILTDFFAFSSFLRFENSLLISEDKCVLS